MLAVPDLVPLPERLAEARRGLGEHGVLVERLARALAAELPLFARDGGFIAAGIRTSSTSGAGCATRAAA